MTVPLPPSCFKGLSREELERAFDGADFPTRPFAHQLAFLAWAVQHRRAMCWLDVGTGKTLCALYLTRLWGCRKTLVVCPPAVVGTWADEARKHKAGRVLAPTGSGKERRKALSADTNYFVVNYEALKTMFGHNPGGGYVVNADARLPKDFDCIVLDELHHCKERTAIQTQVAALLSARVPYAIGLTGTPVRKLDDLWAQYHVLDGGRTLGRNYWAFLRKYFKKGWYTWEPLPDSREAIMRLVEPVTMRYSRTECIDLPAKSYERRVVRPSEEQSLLAAEVLTTLPLAENRLALTNRLLDLSRIAGGFAPEKDGLRKLKKNPKLDELIRFVLWELPQDARAVVFHHFVGEGRAIAAGLRKAGVGVAELRGEVSDRGTEIARFRSGEARVLVANPRCGGEGLNLSEASVCLFYSFPFEGGISRMQAEGRVWRAGQTRPCLYVDFLMEKPFVDAAVLDTVESGVELSETVLRRIAQGDGRNPENSS